MKQYIFNIALKLLPYVDIYPLKITRINKLKALIKSLRPVKSDKELIRLGPDGDTSGNTANVWPLPIRSRGVGRAGS